MTSWSISIKTVGGRSAHRRAESAPGGIGGCASAITNGTHNNAGTAAAGGSSSSHGHRPADAADANFTIEVDPDGPLHSLHEKIESVTGLRAEQQRLIYRGRIIHGGQQRKEPPPATGGGRRAGPTEAEILLGDPRPPAEDVSPPSSGASPTPNEESDVPRVRDVKGLCDNQTIHLVPRPTNTTNTTSNRNATAGYGGSAGMAGGMDDLMDGNTGGVGGFGTLLGLGGALGDIGGGGTNVTSLSGEAGMSLLAALLGASPGGGGGGPTTTNAGGGSTGAVAGSAEGLGDVVQRAVLMGVLDEGAALGGGGGATAPLGRGGGTAALGGGDAVAHVLAALRDSDPSNTTTTTTTNAAGRTGLRGTLARDPDTFPRLAPLGGGARRTMSRRNRTTPTASAAARARASAARLTEADVRAPDPGTAEPVRQGLMTLHTLLGNAERDRRAAGGATEAAAAAAARSWSPPPVRAPLDAHRRWYRGQWLDALDTVHQWLEATVVDIVLPSDILPNYSLVRASVRNGDGFARRRRRAAPDAVVSANDLEGRRRLLLEPLPDDHDFFASHDESDILYDGMRPRPDNHGVQLLLIHYNGWPHRWDEWIRSDSERLRPFRTRSRARGTTNHGGHAAGPTPNAVFPSAPSTVIGDEEDDVAERAALLGEVHGVLGRVERLMGEAVAGGGGGRAESSAGGGGPGSPMMQVDGTGSPASLGSETSHLPWRRPPRPSNAINVEALLSHADDHEEGDAGSDAATCPLPAKDPRHQLDAARLRQLAPMIDRLGRMLTDAAPHIVALADSLPPPTATMTPGNATATALPATAVGEDTDGTQRLAAQASHLYFGIGDEGNQGRSDPVTVVQYTDRSAAATLSSMLGEVDGVDATTAAGASNVGVAGGFSSVTSSATIPASSDANLSEEVIHEETTTIIDPDLTDYVNGMVNTSSRGAGGSRDRGSGGDSTGTSLLAQYLSSLGSGGSRDTAASNNSDGNTRVIRMSGGGAGGGTPGIDIHIHAIVTGPGMAGADLDLGDVGGLGTATTSPASRNGGRSSANNSSFEPTTATNHNDDTDLFSELYSESPAPVNLHGDDETRIAGIQEEDGGNDLNLLFDECRSIDEEESSDGTERQMMASDTEVVAATNNRLDGSDSSGSMLALSEIESQESGVASPPRRTTTPTSDRSTPTTASATPTPQLSLRLGGSNSSGGTPRSPSFPNRLFRRTLGRLSSSRRSGGRSS